MIWSDNVGAEKATDKGAAKQFDQNALIHAIWLRMAELGIYAWVDRVPTKLNIADLPSRRERLKLSGVSLMQHAVSLQGKLRPAATPWCCARQRPFGRCFPPSSDMGGPDSSGQAVTLETWPPVSHKRTCIGAPMASLPARTVYTQSLSRYLHTRISHDAVLACAPPHL